MNTKLSPELISEVNKKLVWALRDSDAENVCLECAKEHFKSWIVTSHNESQWTMSDTGLCTYCGSKKDVFCEAVIKIQRESGLDPKDFLGNFPRILGGSEALSRRNLIINKSDARFVPKAGYVMFDEKSSPDCSRSQKRQINWKKLVLYSAVSMIIGFLIGSLVKAESYRVKMVEGIEKVDPIRVKTNKKILSDYDQMKANGLKLSIDQVIRKEHVESTLQKEQEKLDVVKSSLKPLNYYLYSENAFMAINDVDVILTSKMEIQNVLWQYKNANMFQMDSSKK